MWVLNMQSTFCELNRKIINSGMCSMLIFYLLDNDDHSMLSKQTDAILILVIRVKTRAEGGRRTRGQRPASLCRSILRSPAINAYDTWRKWKNWKIYRVLNSFLQLWTSISGLPTFCRTLLVSRTIFLPCLGCIRHKTYWVNVFCHRKMVNAN